MSNLNELIHEAEVERARIEGRLEALRSFQALQPSTERQHSPRRRIAKARKANVAKVVEFLRANPENWFTADAVAANMPFGITTTRISLRSALASGKIEAREERVNGNPRPRHFYRAHEERGVEIVR